MKKDIKNKFIKFSLVGIFIANLVIAVEPGLYSKKSQEYADLSNAIGSADRVLYLNSAGKYTMNIGRVQGGVFHPVEFSLDQLDGFLAVEKHKQCLVVKIGKMALDGEDSGAGKEGVVLLEKFKKYRYKRVIFLQMNGFGGLDILLDFRESAKEE